MRLPGGLIELRGVLQGGRIRVPSQFVLRESQRVQGDGIWLIVVEKPAVRNNCECRARLTETHQQIHHLTHFFLLRIHHVHPNDVAPKLQ